MNKVLILILLEYGLRPVEWCDLVDDNDRLNPYSTGIWSATSIFQRNSAFPWRLNPYSTGIWSATRPKDANPYLPTGS